MLKRIQANYSTADMGTMDEIGYMPTAEELAGGGKTWGELVKQKEVEQSFRGKHQCLLCPDKVLETDAALKLHLMSKSHKRNLAKRCKESKEELAKMKMAVAEIKSKVARRYLFNTPRYRKLANLGIHYKLRA